MMLFWAGLRGAVGVALAAGFKGENAQTLRTTVLVVVVLSVVMFGGTTAYMLEVLGIRTGVEDDAASSSDEEDIPRTGWYGGYGRRSGTSRMNGYNDDDDDGYLAAQQAAALQGRSRVGVHYGQVRSYNHQAQTPLGATTNNNTIFSAASSDSYDSDVEVLPLAPTARDPDSARAKGGSRSGSRTPGGGSSANAATASASLLPEDGKWFQALDERYLLPLFSNATASRTSHARRARRASGPGAGGSRLATPGESDEEGEGGTELDLTAGVGGRAADGEGAARAIPRAGADESRLERGLASPMLRRDSEGPSRDRSP
jgi:solute carrier family 9 (sodium/hydrogen exchanger), member 6/7